MNHCYIIAAIATSSRPVKISFVNPRRFLGVVVVEEVRCYSGRRQRYVIVVAFREDSHFEEIIARRGIDRRMMI